MGILAQMLCKINDIKWLWVKSFCLIPASSYENCRIFTIKDHKEQLTLSSYL